MEVFKLKLVKLNVKLVKLVLIIVLGVLVGVEIEKLLINVIVFKGIMILIKVWNLASNVL